MGPASNSGNKIYSSGIMDSGDSGEGRVGGRWGMKNRIWEYNVHYSGNGYTKIPDFTTMQYIHDKKLHLYPLNLYK